VLIKTCNTHLASTSIRGHVNRTLVRMRMWAVKFNRSSDSPCRNANLSLYNYKAYKRWDHFVIGSIWERWLQFGWFECTKLLRLPICSWQELQRYHLLEVLSVSDGLQSPHRHCRQTAFNSCSRLRPSNRQNDSPHHQTETKATSSTRRPPSEVLCTEAVSGLGSNSKARAKIGCQLSSLSHVARRKILIKSVIVIEI